MAEALPISGQIDAKAFPFLLVDLHRQGATGSLKVEGPTHQKALYLRGGRILFGSSNDPRDQLGAILVESGKVTALQLEDVNKKVGPGNPLAKALSDSGIVSQRELSEAARAKVERILSDVLSYPSGSFEFEDGVLPKGAVDLKLSTERLFVAAVRRISDRGFVLRHLEGLDVVLKPASGMDERIGEVQSETSGLEGQLDGSRSLKEAASRSGIEEFEAAKIACALVFLKLLEPGEAPGGGEDLNPFFVEGGGSAEIDLGGDSPSTLPFGAEDDAGTRPMEAVPAMDSEPTLVMGDAPISFTFPGPEAASGPEVVSEAEVAPPPPAFAPPEPEPEPTPPPMSSSPSGLPPLKIIPPPKVGDRTRPPTKTAKDDLAALDMLLKNKSVEGPLAPLSKQPDDRWEPSFLPEKKAQPKHRRGGKQVRHGGESAGRGKLMLIGGGAAALLVAAAGGYWYMTNEPVKRVRVAQAPSPKPVAPSPAESPTAGATTASPGAAAAGPGAVAASPAATGSVGASPATGSPAPAAAKPTPAPVATPAAKPTPTPVPPKATGTPAAAKPTPAPAPAKAAAAPAAGGVANARAAFRRGQFPEAARGFLANAQAARGYTVQLLVACSDETVQKASTAVAADELFILPVHYRGRDCYRLLWGLYDDQKRAEAAVRSVPAYFREGGAAPKAVSTASILK
ncbi:MAG: DUF4388 domain-containing protein [Vicinamibacteria bacterium]